MNRKEIAEIVSKADENGRFVADATYVVRNSNGTFSVTDNGEEIAGLTAEKAVRIIEENLAE